MSRYVDAEYVKAVMLNDRLMQGNAEYELWKQKVDEQVKAMPGIEIIRCGECKHRRNDGFCTRPLYSIEYQYMRADDFCSYGCREERSSE